MRILQTQAFAFLCILIGCQPAQSPENAPSSEHSLEAGMTLFNQGQALENEDFDSAMSVYQVAWDIFLATPDSLRVEPYWLKMTETGGKLVNGYLLKNDTLQAEGIVSLLEKHLDDGQHLEKTARARLLLSKGALHLKKGETGEAKLLFDRAKEWTGAGLENELDLWLGNYFVQAAQMDFAQVCFGRVVERQKQNKEHPAYSQALWGLFVSKHPDRDGLLDSLIYLNEAKIVSARPYIMALTEKSVQHYRLSQIDSFKSVAEKAFSVQSKVYGSDDPYLKDRLYNVLGVAYQQTGNQEKAIELFEKTILLLEKYGPKEEIPGKKMNIGLALKGMGKLDAALEKYKESLEGAKSFNDTERMMWCYNNLGNLYKDLGQFDSSETNQRLSLELKRKAGNDAWVANSYFNLGQLYNDWGKHDRAEKFLDTARLIYETRLGEKSGTSISNLYNHYGWSFIGRQMYGPALVHFQKSIAALCPSFDPAATDSSPNLDSTIYDRIQLLYPLAGKAAVLHQRNEGNDALLAYQTYRVASGLIDSIRTRFTYEGSKQELMDKARLVYEGAIEHAATNFAKTKDEAYRAEIFSYMEKSKSVVLGEAINDSKVKFQTIDPKRLVRETELKKIQGDLEKAIRDHENGSKPLAADVLSQTKEKAFETKRAWDVFLDSLERDHPLYRKLKYDFSIPGIADIQQHLKNPDNRHTAVVEYFLGDSTLVILGISENQAVCRLAKFDDSLQNDLDTLRRIVTDTRPGTHGSEKWKRDFDAFTQVARRLYQSLLAPVLDSLTARDLVIIPDGVLGLVPFQVLLTEGVDAEVSAAHQYQLLPYLVKQYNIRSEYSARLLLDNTSEKKQFKINYAGFAPVYPQNITAGETSPPIAFMDVSTHVRGALDSLKYNVEEVGSVAGITGGLTFLGPDASEEKFKEIVPGTAILHLSMHGIVDNENPLYSQLAFTKTDENEEFNSLYAYELYSMSVPAELAVLSACNTGYGKLKRGEGIMSLSRAFKYAGCSNIVMTLWPANDQSTNTIVVDFFKNLKAGQRKDGALRQATLRYLEGKDVDKSHPFYWSHFILIGDGAGVAISGGTSWWWLFAGGGLLVMLLLWARSKKRKMR